MKEHDISSIRKDYLLKSLSIADLSVDPFRQFKTWFDQAIQSDVTEPNVMTLSTCGLDGYPDARIVLLKGLEDNRFVFYTNYQSDKGRQLDKLPKVALTFHWKALERMVRIQGDVSRVDAATSDAYFASRDKKSQIGAWASPQSQRIETRSFLEKRVTDFSKKFDGKEVKRPEHWGGYSVDPISFIFWQGRASRLHDQFRYSLESDIWVVNRLAP